MKIKNLKCINFLYLKEDWYDKNNEEETEWKKEN